MKTLSIIIPCFNEKNNISLILEKVRSVVLPFDIQKEVIIVDDYSTDGTRDILSFLDTNVYKIIFQDKNYGKGYAVRTGITHATGEYIIIQDADLEYDPGDYVSLLQTLITDDLPVVYGSRRMNKTNKAYSSKIHYIGANITTLIINMLYGVHLTDANTCYKMFTRKSIQDAHFFSQRFDFDQEITSFFLKKYRTIKEIPIHYYPRAAEEGKKINIYDFFHAIDVILKYKYGFRKKSRTLLKIVLMLSGAICVFGVLLYVLLLLGIYQQHNYRSIAIAFVGADLLLYWGIKFMFFGSTRVPIKKACYNYMIHIGILLFFYFLGVFYFVKIAQGQGFYQGLFFMMMSVLMVSGGSFITNIIKGLQEME